MELIGEVNPDHKGFQELFRDGDKFVIVSTVGDIAKSFASPSDKAIGNIANLIGGYATNGEETMAFPANESGEVTDWGEIAVATGEGSRQKVLQMLSEFGG